MSGVDTRAPAAVAPAEALDLLETLLHARSRATGYGFHRTASRLSKAITRLRSEIVEVVRVPSLTVNWTVSPARQQRDKE